MAAIYTAKKYINLHTPISIDFGSMLNDMNVTYTLDQIKGCAKCFNQLAILIQKSKLQMIVKKFKSAKYFEVARIVSQGTQSN